MNKAGDVDIELPRDGAPHAGRGSGKASEEWEWELKKNL
jgi:hypothetical protein